MILVIFAQTQYYCSPGHKKTSNIYSNYPKTSNIIVAFQHYLVLVHVKRNRHGRVRLHPYPVTNLYGGIALPPNEPAELDV
jgi:hypothetical protein